MKKCERVIASSAELKEKVFRPKNEPESSKKHLLVSGYNFAFAFGGNSLSQLTQKAKSYPSILFENCCFTIQFNTLKHTGLSTFSPNIDLEFRNCMFTDLNLANSSFPKKIRFRNCVFNKVNFDNTKFADLCDFWRCTFNDKVIFYKTDFLATTVFAATTFHENVLFTYSLFEKLIIFRGALFNKGLDLSLSIGKGDLNFFNMDLNDYQAEAILAPVKHDNDLIYEKWVSDEAIIPLKNKQETFRIIKSALIKQDNISESIKFKVYENETLRTRLKYSKYRDKSLKEKWYSWRKLSFAIGVKLDTLTLWLNKVSNFHGKSFGRSLIFIVFVGWFFFYWSSIFTNKFQMACSINWGSFKEGLSYFIQFLLPTHKFDYISKQNEWPFYLFDFLGRLFVGYGIYQFIQAFRKFR